MTDNTNTNGTEGQTVSTQATEGQTTAPATPTAPQQPSNTSMTDGVVDNTEGKTKSIIPDGFDEDIFDTETMTLKQDKVAERLKNQVGEIEKYKKQAMDMRRKLSKGVDTPATKEEYADGYAFDSKYDIAMSEDTPVSQYVNGSMKYIDEVAMDNGFTLQQANLVKDMFMKVMEDVQLIDTRSEEQKQEARAKFIAEQKEKLGEHAETIIRQNAEWVANYNFFDKGEKQVLNDLVKNSATGNMIVAKIRKLFGQNNIEIPATVSVDGLADDVTLAKEYNDPKTTNERRIEIIKQRTAAGRTNKLPTV